MGSPGIRWHSGHGGDRGAGHQFAKQLASGTDQVGLTNVRGGWPVAASGPDHRQQVTRSQGGASTRKRGVAARAMLCPRRAALRQMYRPGSEPNTDVQETADRQPRRDRLPDHPHLPQARHRDGGGLLRGRRRRAPRPAGGREGPARVRRRRRESYLADRPDRRGLPRDRRRGGPSGLRLSVRARGLRARRWRRPASSSSARPSAAIEAMGDKIESKRLARQAGVSTVPGTLDAVARPGRGAADRARDRLPGDGQGLGRRRRQGHAHRPRR